MIEGLIILALLFIADKIKWAKLNYNAQQQYLNNSKKMNDRE